MKSKLILLVGPPGSGKSTFAQNYQLIRDNIPYHCTYINQDSQGKEHLKLFNDTIKLHVDIIVDRMNFDKKQRERYLKPAREKGYETEIIVIHESRQTCLDRCIKRANNHETITNEEFAHKAINMFFSKYERVEDSEADVVTRLWLQVDLKLNAIICDLDGTMCNLDHRLHYVKQEKKDWKNFLSNIDKDGLNQWCRTITNSLRMNNIIVFCSGRDDNYREKTTKWLSENKCHYDWLFMRPRDDYRQDFIVKEIILEFELLTRFNILFTIDDRKQVVDMWRKHGLTCLACAEGEF